MRFSSSSKTSQRRLVKISGRMKSLNFGASCAPRMLHAASQIQDSSDLSLVLFILQGRVDAWFNVQHKTRSSVRHASNKNVLLDLTASPVHLQSAQLPSILPTIRSSEHPRTNDQ